jgi:hypothetical protein
MNGGPTTLSPGTPEPTSPAWLAWARPAWARRVPAYAIGGVSAFWVVERVATF